MKVKVIAIKRVSRTEPGGELLLRKDMANALVKLGKVRYADESQAPETAPTAEKPKRVRARRAPTGAPVGAVTRASAAGITSAPPVAEPAPAPEETTNEPGAVE